MRHARTHKLQTCGPTVHSYTVVWPEHFTVDDFNSLQTKCLRFAVNVKLNVPNELKSLLQN